MNEIITQSPEEIKEKERAYSAVYYAAHKEERAAYKKHKRANHRAEVLSHYGGKCACCGETTYEFFGNRPHKRRRRETQKRSRSQQPRYDWMVNKKQLSRRLPNLMP